MSDKEYKMSFVSQSLGIAAPDLGQVARTAMLCGFQRYGTASTGRAISGLRGVAKDSAGRAAVGRAFGGRGMVAGDRTLAIAESTIAVAAFAAAIAFELKRRSAFESAEMATPESNQGSRR